MELVINNVTERDDGSCDVDLSYDEECLLMAKDWAKKWHPDMEDEQDIMHAYVINILEEGIKDVEGTQDDKK
jgi:hypothetical protein